MGSERFHVMLSGHWEGLREEAADNWPLVLTRCAQVVSSIPAHPNFGDIRLLARELGELVAWYPSAGRLRDIIMLSVGDDRDPVPPDDVRNRLRDLIEKEMERERKRRRQEEGEAVAASASAGEPATAEATDAEG